MNQIIIGAGFGDEGKGQTVVDLIAENPYYYKYVIRFNGGHQAGHTGIYQGIRHVFSNFTCGTLFSMPSYWSRFCTIHPKGIMNEYNVLQSKGLKPELWIDPLCPVTLSWDIEHNQNNIKHGTVGVGFGSTIQRHESFYKIFAQDLLNKEILKMKLELIKENYYPESFDDLDEFYNEINWLINNENIKIQKPKDIDDYSVIFEGAQGILLDQDFGFFPHVTRSKTTTHNVKILIDELKITGDFQIKYVTRSYHTRHGDGPFFENEEYLDLRDDIIETNIDHQYQGQFRKTILNTDVLIHAIALSEAERNFDANVEIVMTCFDHHKADKFYVVENNKVVKKNKNIIHRLNFKL